MGKTAIRRRYFGQGFEKNYQVTLGADFALKRLGTSVIQVWDLAGQSVYRHIRKRYYRDAHGAIVVFDLSRAETYEKLVYWIDEILVNNDGMIPAVIVGNKLDLVEEEDLVLMEEKLESFLVDLRIKHNFEFRYIQSSALTGHNVDSVFDDLLHEIMNR